MSKPPSTNEVAEEIKKLDWDRPEDYHVEWSSVKRWDYDATYDVKEIRFGEGGRPMMLIKGPKGGEYLIDSNPTGIPQVKHLRSDGYESTDRLAELDIYEETMSWHHRLIKTIKTSARTASDITGD